MTPRIPRFAPPVAALFVALVAAGCGDSFKPAPHSVPTIVSFTTNPDRIDSGASALVTWRVEDADSVVITPGIGRVATPDSGSITVTPSSTTTYVLTAYGIAGSRTASATLTVGTSVPSCGSNALTLQSLTCTPAAFSNDQPRQLELRGQNFLPTMIVKLGDTELTPVSVIGDTLALVTVPATFAPGVYQMTVQFSPLGPALAIAHAVIVTQAVTSGTTIATHITSNTALTMAGNPYRLIGPTTVENGATLTIEPGVVLLASSGAGLTLTAGTQLVAGAGADPVVFTSVDGRSGPHWGSLEFRAGSGPHMLQNVIVELGGQGTSGSLVRVLTSTTSLCDVIARESASNGFGFALEAGGQLPQATGLYSAVNGAAGIFIDGGTGLTSGTPVGVVRNNAIGVTRTGFTVPDCPRWDLSGLIYHSNLGGDVGPCP